ncbi:MAG: SRPBCC family protein [Bacteroidota bacterium]
MTTSNFTTTLLVDQSATAVFTAINNVRGWWSEEIEGITDQLNQEWAYHYQDVHRCNMKITELVPGQKIVWEVLDNQFSFTKDKNEWIGNKLIFEITPQGTQTQLRFTQVGLVPEYECYDICQNAWNTYIQKSLYSLITTGKGQPNSKETAQTEDEKRLASTNFTTTFFVNHTPQEVYTAINNVRGWWQGDIEGNTDTLHESFSYRVPGIHFSKQHIVELIPNQKVVWNVTESELTFVETKNEWTNTQLVFEISEINNKTQVRFTHVGLVPTFECYGGCSGAWEDLIQKSLFSLITTGKGVNVFG